MYKILPEYSQRWRKIILYQKGEAVDMSAKRIIKLSYKVQNKFEAEFIAGYFRFIGVMVAQEIYHTDSIQKEDSEKYDDHVIFEQIPEYRSNNNYYDHDKEKQIFLIQWINENVFENNDFLDQIGQIFVDEYIMQVSCIRHDYPTQITWIQKICDKYINAYEKILKINEKGMDEALLLYGKYAKLYCKEKINKLFQLVFGEMGLKYDTRELIYEMEKILEENQDFYNIYVLQGLTTNLDARYCRDTPEYLLKCINKLKDTNNEVLSFVYYRIGLSYQRKQDNDNEAFKYYQYAAESCKKNYKAFYRLGIYDLKLLKNDKKAEKHFKKALDILDEMNKSSWEYLKPEEFLYYYKLCREIGIINVRFKENKNEALRYFGLAKNIYESMSQKNIYMKKMFKNDNNIFCNMIKSDIDIETNESDIRVLTEG